MAKRWNGDKPVAVGSDMERTGDVAVRACLIASLLGLVGAALFKDTWIGLNLPVWLGSVMVCVLYCAFRAGSRPSRTTMVGLALAMLSSVGLGWYSSPDLQVANWIGVASGLGLSAVGLSSFRVGAMSAWSLAGRMVGEAVVAFVEGASVVANVPWKRLSESPVARKNSAVLRGALIATPLVLLFGALFSSADAVFNKTVVDAFSFDFNDFFEWGALWVVFAAIGLCVVGGLAVPAARKPPIQGPSVAPQKIGMTEVSVVLCSLCGLFGLFVAIQFQYLFGGSAAVVGTTGLTYSDYARKGFFELTWVAALMLPLLVGAYSLAKQESRRETLAFRVMATVLTGLLFVVMASAMTRMQMYIESYGLTPLRVSSSAFMLWLALVFSWFLASLFRSKMPQFAVGALVAGFAVIFGLNFATPDSISARYNVARFGATPDLDAEHLAALGAETVPFVLSSLDRLSPNAQYTVMSRYRQRFDSDLDWRGATVSELVATEKLKSH